MKTYCGVHVKKCSSVAEVNATLQHNSRSSKPDNAEPNGNVLDMMKQNNFWESWKKLVKPDSGKIRITKASVRVAELFCYASPEYFRPGNNEQAGYYEKEPTEKWMRTTWKWLKSLYGERLLDVRLHLDETTPHIHALVVPLTEDGRLSAKDVFNRTALRELQSSYAAACAPLGLSRGESGSRAKHQDIQSYYRAVNTTNPPIPDPAEMVRRINKNPALAEELWRGTADYARLKEKYGQLDNENKGLRRFIRKLQKSSPSEISALLQQFEKTSGIDFSYKNQI